MRSPLFAVCCLLFNARHSAFPIHPIRGLRMHPRSFALLVACLLAPLAVTAQQPKGKKKEAAKPAAAQPAPVLDSLVIPTAFRARSIGPAVMGGRVAAIALDPTDPWTYYVGLGTGGIMKTTDNGTTFKAIFEHEGVAAIGALAIAPSDHD